MHEGCSVTCYLHKTNIQFSRVVNYSKPPECCLAKVQSCFNCQWRKLKKWREVSLGSCWEIGTLSKTKRPSWTSHTPSENASFSLFSTIFMTDFFVALHGRNLCVSSWREFSELNLKYVATWLKQWKRKNGEYMWQILLIIRFGMSRKGKTNH